MEELLYKLTAVVGEQFLLADESNRVLYSQDIWQRGETCAAVVQPADREQLAQLVAITTEAGYAVIARGGGMSYTRAYTPDEANSVIVDCRRMNRILEINREDMYVTVEAGCTWKSLYEALKGSGVRTPYWGTLSGIKATVGGSISQNSIFWGGGQYGSAVDSVLGMDVVLADGSVLSTGSAAQINASPFFRHFGPDLTGIFTCDSGALGIKASVTLRLVPEFAARAYASFDFADYVPLLNTMNEISRQGLAMECFGFDPSLTAMRARRESVMSDAKSMLGVLKSSDSVMSAIKDGARIAMAGRSFMKDLLWPLYINIEERTESSAEAALQQIRQIAANHGGREVANSIPKILRGNPFGPVNNMIGPDGERWVPVHGLVALSQAIPATAGVMDIFERHRKLIDRYVIQTGFLYNNISTNCIAIEPLFFWPDAVDDIHRDSVEPQYYRRVPKREENLQARAAVALIRQEIVDYFSSIGAAHLQIGRSYHYASALKSPALDLVRSIKRAVDPCGKMNPGVLGL